MPNRFVIAVRRNQRTRIPADWIHRIRATAGVRVHSQPASDCLIVDASPEAVSLLHRQLDPFVWIEPEATHVMSDLG